MRDNLRLGALACGLLVAAVAGNAHADAARTGATRVGLVVATRVNLTDAEADAYAFRLGEALTDKLDIDVIAGAEARRRLPPAGIADDCVARTGCVRDVATRLDGDQLLFLFLVRIGSRVQIDVTWADPRRGAVTSRPALILDEKPGSPRTAARAFAAAPRALLPNAAPRASFGAMASTGAASSGELSGDLPSPAIDDLGGRGRRFTTPVIVAGAVATAALATGIGFAIAARQDYQSLEDDGCDRDACPDSDERVDRMERRALVADVMFAGAGAAAVTGLVLYLTSADSAPPVRVSRTDGGGIVSFAGSF